MSKISKQLKLTSSAIDLIKMSQRSQHISIKEALRKMLKCISMMAEADDGRMSAIIDKKIATRRTVLVDNNQIRGSEILSRPVYGTPIKIDDKEDLLKQAEKIAERSKTNDLSKTKS